MTTSKKFKIYERKRASGNIGYRVDLGEINGRRKFKDFGSKEAAEAYRNQCIVQGANVRVEVLQELDAAVRHDILACLERLREAGSDIKEATDFFLKHSKPSNGSITLSKLVELWEKVKKGAGMSDRYLTTAQFSYFTPFIKHVKDCKVMEVTKEASEKYLYGNKNWNATTIKTTHTYLTTLFNFAIKEGYATLNPFAKVQRTKRIASTAKDRVLPVGAVQALLQYALDTKHYAECASYVLTFFCGVRSEEVTRVKWEDIKLDEEKPVVVVDYPKIAHQRRINALPENAIAWLRLCNDEGKAKGIVAPDNYNQRMMRLRRRFYRDIETQREYEGKIAAGKKVDKNDEPAKLFAFPANTDLSYHQNSARICFASYHIAFHEDAAKTSMLLGHQTSSALLYTTYRALVTKAEAEKYWKIVPGKDVTIPTPIDRAAKGKRLAAAVPADAPAPVLALPAPVAAE